MIDNMASHYILINDINASITSTWSDGLGDGFMPVGNMNNMFTGSLDGSGYAITDLYISRSGTDDIALFGYVNGARISDLHLQNVNITGGSGVASLIYWCEDTEVDQVSATGDVYYSTYGAGLIASVNYGSTVTDSWADVDLHGGNVVGGIAYGVLNSASIVRCYSVGLVPSQALSGGIAAQSSGGIITDSFYDYETSGLHPSGYGTAKTNCADADTEYFYQLGFCKHMENVGIPDTIQSDIW
jgi:M26 IgA1-specific Metallo-endopeptidase N-terminal region.